MSIGSFNVDDPVARLPSGEAARLDRAVRGLKPVERKMLILSRLKGLSHSEIAREVGLPEGDVKRVLVNVLLSLARPPEGSK
jgi:DNA-directed RNA polymerase specialized sigma24 family protein